MPTLTWRLLIYNEKRRFGLTEAFIPPTKGHEYLMGSVRNFVWLRWTLLCEYPKQFLLVPLSLLVVGLVLFGLGVTADSPVTIVMLVYAAYVAWLTAVVSFILMLLFMRPDQDGM